MTERQNPRCFRNENDPHGFCGDFSSFEALTL
jgi:hypothetical protein